MTSYERTALKGISSQQHEHSIPQRKEIIQDLLKSVPTFEKVVLLLISLGFIIWAGLFIYRSSLIAIDGQRYFSLFDDAMISMRYGWNLSHGHGLVWNPGERVEGYTNLLMTLIMALATRFFDKSPAVLSIQLFGILCMLAIAVLSVRISEFIFQNVGSLFQSLSRILVFFCALAYYPAAFWSLMGMETGLLTVLLLASILAACLYIRTRDAGKLLWVGIWLGLAYLTRNDSLIFSMIIWVFLGWEIFRNISKIDHRRQFVASICLCLLVVGGQLLFRYFYYGALLPNTYTLKLGGMPLIARLENGMGFMTPFLRKITPFLLLAGIDLLLAFRKEKLLLFSIVMASIGYQVYVGGDPWPYWRMTSPTMPLLFILVISAINTLLLLSFGKWRHSSLPYGSDKFAGNHPTGGMLIAFTLLCILVANINFLTEISLISKPYTAVDNARNVNTALLLNRLTYPDASIGVTWAGTIPYYADRKAIDYLGKSDRHIAMLAPDLSGAVSWSGMYSVPGHNKYDLNYSIKSLLPSYTQIVEWGKQDISVWARVHYTVITQDGISLTLLNGSPDVKWDLIEVGEIIQRR